MSKSKTINNMGLLVIEKVEAKSIVEGKTEKRIMNRQQMFFLVLTTIASTLIASLFLIIILNNREQLRQDISRFWPGCTPSKTCKIELVESIPENLTYPEGSASFSSTYEGWLNLIQNAKEEIDIASFYWSLLGTDVVNDTSDYQGVSIFNALLEAGTTKGIKIRIAQSQPSHSYPDNDTQTLVEKGAAEVRSVDFDRLVGAGVLHTKMILVDGESFYVGSANMDWRSLTQIKEMGVVVTDCPTLGYDAQKIFEVYWKMGKKGAVVPKKWPSSLKTEFNKDNPLKILLNNKLSNVYLSSSPPRFCPEGRTNDIDSIIDVIEKAEKFVDIAVMDYFPISLYDKETSFWPVIDDELKKAAIERKIHVRLLAGYWNHTRPDMLNYLKSLSSINNQKYKIETRLFKVPTYTESQAKIPFARVAHNKFMVTDKHAYIGTSNWSKDYFTNTGGVGFIVSNAHSDANFSTTVTDLKKVFDRDWYSEYTKNLTEFL